MIHPLIANKYSCVLTVLLPFSNFGSPQRWYLTSKTQTIQIRERSAVYLRVTAADTDSNQRAL